MKHPSSPSLTISSSLSPSVPSRTMPGVDRKPLPPGYVLHERPKYRERSGTALVVVSPSGRKFRSIKAAWADHTRHAVLPVGARCWYQDAQGDERESEVAGVHYDDDVPYYTIRLDGNERSTVRERLRPMQESSPRTQNRQLIYDRLVKRTDGCARYAERLCAVEGGDFEALVYALVKDDGAWRERLLASVGLPREVYDRLRERAEVEMRELEVEVEVSWSDDEEDARDP